MSEDRQTEPGGVLKAYEKAKSKVQDLASRGKQEAKSVLSGKPQEDPLTAGNSWEEGKSPRPVSDAQEDRSQEEMDETFGSGEPGDDRRRDARSDLPDGTATMTAEDIEAAAASDVESGADAGIDTPDVEIESPDLREGDSIGAGDNPDAPEITPVNRMRPGTMADDEDGRVPSEGLGLDDGPGVTYPDDARTSR